MAMKKILNECLLYMSQISDTVIWSMFKPLIKIIETSPKTGSMLVRKEKFYKLKHEKPLNYTCGKKAGTKAFHDDKIIHKYMKLNAFLYSTSVLQVFLFILFQTI